MEALEDFFYPGAGRYAHLLQVGAGEGWFDIAELGKISLDMLASHRGVGSQGISRKGCGGVAVEKVVNAARCQSGVSQRIKLGFKASGVPQGLG